MKRIIITAATSNEIELFVSFLEAHYFCVTPHVYQNEYWSIHIVFSGVGMMNTAFRLAKEFEQHEYDMAIQAGIAGAFDTNVALGSVFAVRSEQYGDLGAEDKDGFIDIFSLGFQELDNHPFSKGKLPNHHPIFIGNTLPLVDAISVNTVSGHKDTIHERRARYDCDIESMEGIAFHYTCLLQQVPFLQIRAISNHVLPRDKSLWNIRLAIENLNQYLINTFSTNTTHL